MKFTLPTEVTATYKIVTPLFLGGDDHKADAEHFRNASFKGALRFWWRALNWGRVLRQANNNPEQGLKYLHKEESNLFGAASDGKESKQSRVMLSSKLIDSKLEPAGQSLKSISYLLGQGLYDFKAGLKRNYISGGNLSITLNFKLGTLDEQIESVKQAAIALGIFGGLGSRSRRGLGSLAIQTIRAGEKNLNFTKIQAIKEFIGNLDFSAPAASPLTVINQGTRIDISATGANSIDTLAIINEEMQLYRSYGRNGKVGHKEARQNFIPDHDNILKTLNNEKILELPKRSAFGLPHNYFYSSLNRKVDINPEIDGRRASPLFIHIHELENSQFVAVQTLLPTTFLPTGVKVDIKPQNAKNQTLENNKVDYGVVHRYLDGFDNREVLRNGK